jgi:1-phosphatidylinositol phosphodiesterase
LTQAGWPATFEGNIASITVAMFTPLFFRIIMGRGAYLTLVNQTDFELIFGTSDKSYCWKDDTIAAVHGTIPPRGQSPQFYIESSSAFPYCTSADADVKVWAHPTGRSDDHFANTHLRQTNGGYRQVDVYQKSFQAEAVVRPHPGGGQQDDITVYVGLPLNRSRWITDTVKDKNRPLTALNLPGTHDSGAHGDYLFDLDGWRGNAPIDKDAYARCQDWTIAEQLAHGIRFLDIRLSSISRIKTGVSAANITGHAIKLIDIAPDALQLVHDKIVYNGTFDTVLSVCEEFLEKNRDEFIVMSVKPDGFGFDDAQWKPYDSQTIFYHGPDFPTVEQAKGKIVLLRRFGGDKFRGFEFDVPDNATAAERSHRVPGAPADYHTAVQDHYEVDLDRAADKLADVQKFMTQYENDTTNRLLVNFTSYVGSSANTATEIVAGVWAGLKNMVFINAQPDALKLPYPREAAALLTAPLLEEVTARSGKRLGVVVMDFPAQAVVDAIIRSN